MLDFAGAGLALESAVGLTRFEREMADLHGPDVLEAARAGGGSYEVRPVFVRQAHRPGAFQAGSRRRVGHVAFRLGAGLLGLFWVIVLGGALVAGAVAAAVFLYAAVTS